MKSRVITQNWNQLFFRILPEGFKNIKDLSTEDIVCVVATDELIKDAWIEKAHEFIDELNKGM